MKESFVGEQISAQEKTVEGDRRELERPMLQSQKSGFLTFTSNTLELCWNPQHLCALCRRLLPVLLQQTFSTNKPKCSLFLPLSVVVVVVLINKPIAHDSFPSLVVVDCFSVAREPWSELIWLLTIVWSLSFYFFFLSCDTCPHVRRCWLSVVLLTIFSFFLSMLQTKKNKKYKCSQTIRLVRLPGLSGMGLFLLTDVLGVTLGRISFLITRKLLSIGVKALQVEGRAAQWLGFICGWFWLIGWCCFGSGWWTWKWEKEWDFIFLTSPYLMPWRILLPISLCNVVEISQPNHLISFFCFFFFSIATPWTPTIKKIIEPICVWREKEQLSNWSRKTQRCQKIWESSSRKREGGGKQGRDSSTCGFP